jgi:hypothetical protein
VAVLAMAVVPTLSHALAHVNGGNGGWAEVCTPQGMKLVALAESTGDAGGPASSAAVSTDHCLVCGVSAGTSVLPAPRAALPPALAGADGPPGPPPRLPLTRVAWANAQPRAPPAVS